MNENVEVQKQEETFQFDITEWEEVPLHEILYVRKQSEVISIENQVPQSSQKVQTQAASSTNNNMNISNQINQNKIDDTYSENIQQSSINENQYSVNQARLLQNQYFMFDYGKKFMKFQKWKEYKQTFVDNYEKKESIYFDPETKVFITSDGIKLEGSSTNQIGTSLIYNSKSKKLVGLSNLSFSLEFPKEYCPLEKKKQDQIEEKNNLNANLNNENKNQNLEQIEDSINQPVPQNDNESKLKSLESIYNWIEKKDKLKQKRIKKLNKTKEDLLQDTSQLSIIKKARNPSMNKLLRKVKK